MRPEITRRVTRSDSLVANRETDAPELVWRSINSIRALSMDVVDQAQSSHPTTRMALAGPGRTSVGGRGAGKVTDLR